MEKNVVARYEPNILIRILVMRVILMCINNMYFKYLYIEIISVLAISCKIFRIQCALFWEKSSVIET